MGGAIAGVALWTVSSFFNGIGRTRVTLVMMLCVAVVNALLNQLFIFELGLGVAGVGLGHHRGAGAGIRRSVWRCS